MSDSAWVVYQFEYLDQLGFIPAMLSDNNKRPACEQLDDGYRHGGGWHPFKGFTLINAETHPKLLFPEDPPIPAIAETAIGDERVIVFHHAWVVILQKDGSFEACRMD